MLGACASSGDYPSLAQRPAERASGTFGPPADPAPPVAEPAPSADLVARLDTLMRDAQSIHAEFIRSAPAAERLARGAGSTGSDSWAAAQVALADLDSLRSRAAVALAELDILWADATLEGGPRDAVGATRDAVIALITREDETLARLRGRIG
ncbi:hypothetical protein GRI40_13580 [Altererythrobacter aerius]|uniref:Uncharacterized protein n=2 Tax=Tsuneonella aeria TaxID=1837929 RepID=A0A6I4TGF1_9SPHN|nr:hypothetical protein [Tsuneonella aeria]MXO76243.1 hypothetical protein [Tsuneonella aeria]